MSREVRRVPVGWIHPTDESGSCIPLFGGSFSARLAEYKQDAGQWTLGYQRSGFGDEAEYKLRDRSSAGITFEEWGGEIPKAENCMPDWPEAERTHYQMYETVTDGTPISPVCASPEALARWLANTFASASGRMTATYEQWLAMIDEGWAPSMAIINGRIISGVEAATVSPQP